MTSYPLVRRTFATLRKAELGFLGVLVMTWVQTPRRNGQLVRAGDLDFTEIFWRPLRTSWLIVGMLERLVLSHRPLASGTSVDWVPVLLRGKIRRNKGRED